MLSAIVFVVDERVFNRKKYPDFGDWVIENFGDLLMTDDTKTSYETRKTLINKLRESTNKEDQKVYQSWVKFIGGEKNVFLIDFLRNFRLA
jgi:TnpA family transposase